MMPHLRRTLAITAGLGVAALIPAVLWPTPATSAVLAYAVPAATGLGALVLLGTVLMWAVPHAARAVHAGYRTSRAAMRGMRARALRRRARRARTIRDTAGAVTGRQRRMARMIVAATVGSILAVATVAVVLNFSHGMDVAAHNGEGGWRAWLYPVTADGLLISTSMVLVWKLLTSGEPSWWPRIGFVSGIAASAGTNVLAALHEPVSGAALWERIGWTTWPTLGLLIAHSVLLMFLTHYARVADVFGTMRPDPKVQAAEQRAEDAENRARFAEQQAATAATAAQQRADEQIRDMQAARDTEHEQHQRAIEELRQQLTSSQDKASAEIRELQDELGTERETAAEATATAAQLRAELDELNTADEDADATATDYEAIRTSARTMVSELRAEHPRESLVATLGRRFRVGHRWLQMHVPEAKEQQDPPTLDQRQLSIA